MQGDNRRGPWVLAMRWQDLLFAHWRVDPAALRPFIPSGLELDLRDGEAWLGVVPFRMSGVRPRWTPPMPGLSAFPELNLRTYVRGGGHSGVWFFSLDAASRVAWPSAWPGPRSTCLTSTRRCAAMSGPMAASTTKANGCIGASCRRS